VEVKQVDISKLRENCFNREVFDDLPTDTYEELKADIWLNGIKTPLEITDDYLIVSGHQRYRIAKELDFKTIPCIINSYRSEDEIKERTIKDNLLRRQLNDIEKVKAGLVLEEIEKKRARERQLSTLKQFTTVVVNLPQREDEKGKTRVKVAKAIGISPKQYEKGKVVLKKGTAEEIEAIKSEKLSIHRAYSNIIREEKRREIRDAVKDVNIEGLVLGDAIEELRKLPAKSVHLVVTDPPWGVDYIPQRQGKALSFEDGKDYALALLDKVCKELKRVLVDNAHLFIFTGWGNCPEFRAIVSKYFEIRNILVWMKNNHTPCDYRKRFANRYEFIIFATQGDRDLNYNVSPDILSFDRVVNPEHGAEKPVELLKYLIGNSSVEGEVVIDPFAGSGSTGVACKELDRNFILIEKEPKWYNLALRRLSDMERRQGDIMKLEVI